MPTLTKMFSKTRLCSNGCIDWNKTKDRQGYGRIQVKGVKHPAHRIIWTLMNGKIPGDKCVCHSCDNPSCINPNHLWMGTKAANNVDKQLKGRATGGRPPGQNRISNREYRLNYYKQYYLKRK